ncbi:MAG: hypothetical protein ACREID_02140 [Planctomycetota bacterium]
MRVLSFTLLLAAVSTDDRLRFGRVAHAQEQAGVTSVVLPITEVRVPEGGSSLLDIKLGQQPGGDVAVSASVTSGTGAFSLAGSSAFTFGPANWSQSQTLTISSGADADTVNQSGGLTVTLNGLPVARILLTQVDAGSGPPPPPAPAPGALKDVTVQGKRFYSDGKPWFLATNFLSAEPNLFTQTYLSDEVSDQTRQHMRDVLKASEYNAIFLYSVCEEDYGGTLITPYAGGVFGGAFDENRIVAWRAKLEALLQEGLRPVIWLLPDDAPTVHDASDLEIKRYFDRMVLAFDDLPVLWVLGLEVDEYLSKARSDTLGGYLQGIARNPVGIHQTPQRTDYMTSTWVDYGVMQFGARWDGHQIYELTKEYQQAVGNKPLVAGEYDFDGGSNDDLKGFGAAFAPCAGCGNGAPKGLAAFMSGLPDGMTSTRSGDTITLTGSGVTAVGKYGPPPTFVIQ